mgnify:CR=1 FL=1
MARNIAYFAGPDDDQEFWQVLLAFGLRPLPYSLDELSKFPNWPQETHFGISGCLSFLPVEKLHPYGNPPHFIGEATDPLIEFTRAYYHPPHLVAGCIHFDPATEFVPETKPYFEKIYRWVRKNWKRIGKCYYGPQAAVLATQKGTIVSDFPPGTKIRQVKVQTKK